MACNNGPTVTDAADWLTQLFNSLSPKIDQDEITPYNINALEKKWS